MPESRELTFPEIVQKLKADSDGSPEFLNLAVSKYDEGESEHLIELLQSTDSSISGLGLHIFGEIGLPAYQVVDFVLPHIQSQNSGDRLDAVVGLVECCDRLSAEQAAKCLSLVEDDLWQIRAYMSLMLSCLDLGILRDAISLLSVGALSERHRDAAKVISDHVPLEKAVEMVASPDTILACYAGAAVLVRRVDAVQLVKLKALADHNKFVGRIVDFVLHQARTRGN